MKQVMLIFTVCLAHLFLFTVNKTAANPQILIPSGEFNMGTEKGAPVRIDFTYKLPATFYTSMSPLEDDFETNVNPDIPYAR